MQQQLRCITARFEHSVSADRFITDQETIEIGAHCQRELGKLLCRAVTTGTAKHVGVARELLIQQRDSPAAHHRVAQLRIGGLQRIVPVAFAVADQMRAWNEAPADRRQRLLDMDRDGVLT